MKPNVRSQSQLVLLVLAASASLADAAPTVRYDVLLELVEGREKTAAIVIDAGTCTLGTPSVRFRRDDTSSWLNGATPTRVLIGSNRATAGAAIWQARLPGSVSYRQGTVIVVEWTVPYGATGRFCNSAGTTQALHRFTVRRAFGLRATPQQLDLPRGGSRAFSIEVTRTPGFTAAVSVTLAGLPASVTASPATVTLTNAPATITLSAAASALPENASLTLSGAATNYTTQTTTVALHIARPTITSVTPALQLRGADATITGTNYDTVCANNVVTIGALDVTPTTCTATTIGFRVPATAPLGATQIRVRVSGMSSNSVAFTVAGVTLTSITPAVQARGGSVVINGTNFDINCVNNQVTMGAMSVVPSSCTSTAINLQVPASIDYGAAAVTVARYGVASAPVFFTVGRQPGSFVNITNDINGQDDSLSCATGEVALQISGSGAHLAEFTRVSDGGLIGSLQFDDESRDMTAYSGATVERLSGPGGAGFSLCNTGIALDLNTTDGSDVFAYRFLRLSEGTRFTFTFSYYSAVITRNGTRYYSGVVPKMFRSPDGTVFIVIAASTTTDEKRAVVIDRESGAVVDDVELPTGGTFSATLTAANTVVITSAGAQRPPITIR